MPDEPPAPGSAASPGGRIASATLRCERCGRPTPHRIFRVRPRGPGVGEGIARCRDCRWTHPFESRPEARVDVPVIVSDGSRSERRSLSFPPDRELAVGGTVPAPDGPLVVHRIDDRRGRATAAGRAGDVATLWTSRARGTVVRVSVIEGATTRSARLETAPDRSFEIGAPLTVDGVALAIVAVRAQGRTYRRPVGAFRADEVERIYARRTVRPPAGRSAWRSGRSTPSVRTSSTSRSPRSRSSPGVRRQRTVPRDRTAAGGAAVQRSSPW